MLSRLQPEFTLHLDYDAPPRTRKDHYDFTIQLQTTITQKAVRTYAKPNTNTIPTPISVFAKLNTIPTLADVSSSTHPMKFQTHP